MGGENRIMERIEVGKQNARREVESLRAQARALESDARRIERAWNLDEEGEREREDFADKLVDGLRVAPLDS